MATGFIYTVSTLTKDYVQQAFCNVPTQFGDRLYFGPCKVPMRPESTPAITSSGYPLRGSVPAESCSLATSRSGSHSGKPTSGFPIFRGPEGPIHVRPISHSDLRALLVRTHSRRNARGSLAEGLGVPGLGCVLRLFFPDRVCGALAWQVWPQD